MVRLFSFLKSQPLAYARSLPFIPFQYKKAVCRAPSEAIALGQRMDTARKMPPLNYELCLRQHSAYVEALRASNISVSVLPAADANYPDSVFVEDTAIIIDKTILITSPGHSTRCGEVETIRKHFQEHEPDMEMSLTEGPARLDGGDVLFTGYEIFVGLSTRSNVDGALAVQQAFPQFPVHTIKVGPSTLHLKSMMGIPELGTISVGESGDAKAAMKEIVQKSERATPYKFISVKGDFSASAILVNGNLIHRCREEYPESCAVYQSLDHKQKFDLNFSELEKVDGSLTCCSLLY